MNNNVLRVDVLPRLGSGLIDSRAISTKKILPREIETKVVNIRTSLGYTVQGDLSKEDRENAAVNLFSDPIIEHYSLDGTIAAGILPDLGHSDITVQVGFKPGVTDNRAMAAEDGLRTLFPGRKTKVASTISYHFWFGENTPDIESIIALLHNPMLEQCVILDSNKRLENLIPFPLIRDQNKRKSETVDLEVSDDELLDISERGLLALNLQEMKAIQSHYRDSDVKRIREELGLPKNAPTDAELECLAQTWSEHCSHKIFAAKIHHTDNETGESSTIDSLFKTHIMKPTLDMQKDADWLLSIFHDNSGVIAWNENWSLCMKAETHNSPSALDPFGGAMTGIVGCLLYTSDAADE